MSFPLEFLLCRGLSFARCVWFDDRHWPEGRSEPDILRVLASQGDTLNAPQGSHLYHQSSCVFLVHSFLP